MNNFLVALSLVFPMVVMMSIGILIRKVGIIDRAIARRMDGVGFRVFLPCLLFYNIYKSDLGQDLRLPLILYTLAGFLVLFVCALLIAPRVIKSPAQVPVIAQVLFRANYVIFGQTIVENLFGSENLGPSSLLAVIIVPVINISSVFVLEYFRPDGSHSITAKRLLSGVLKNPLIISSLAALATVVFGIKLPDMVLSPIISLSRVATPLAFVLLGATLSLDGFRSNRKLIALWLAVRMILVPTVTLGIAVLLGFRGVELAVLMAFFAAPTAVSTFSMSQQMGADGDLAAQMVAATSVSALGTVFFITFILQSMGFL